MPWKPVKKIEKKKNPENMNVIGYCKFRNFPENFIFANSAKRHICHVENSRIGHDLPTSVNDRVISAFCEGLIFTKLHSR